MKVKTESRVETNLVVYYVEILVQIFRHYLRFRIQSNLNFKIHDITSYLDLSDIYSWNHTKVDELQNII